MTDFLMISCRSGLDALARWGKPQQIAPDAWTLRCGLNADEALTLQSQMRQRWQAGASMGMRPLAQTYRAVVFDFDATLIVEESLDVLAEKFGCGPAVQRLTEQAMAGEMSFRDALAKRLQLLKGMPRVLVETQAQHLTLHQGSLALAEACQAAGVALYIASGGFHGLIAPVAQKIGAQKVLANNFRWDDDATFTGFADSAVIDAQAKAAFVGELATKWGRDHIIAIGDGANDRLMMQEAGLAVGFHPKPVLYSHLQVVNQTGSHDFLRALLWP